MARYPAFLLQALWDNKQQLADSGDVATQTRAFAIFDTRAPVYAMLHHPLLSLEHSSQRFPGGHRREVCRWSPSLHCITQGQQLSQRVTQKTYGDVAL